MTIIIWYYSSIINVLKWNRLSYWSVNYELIDIMWVILPPFFIVLMCTVMTLVSYIIYTRTHQSDGSITVYTYIVIIYTLLILCFVDGSLGVNCNQSLLIIPSLPCSLLCTLLSVLSAAWSWWVRTCVLMSNDMCLSSYSTVYTVSQ